jgi:nucleoside recognition membrane protein YjiH
MDKILTLTQMQNMSIDNIIDAYKNGYTLNEMTESQPFLQSLPMQLPMQSTEIKSLQHYTSSDVGVIALAIGVSVVIMGGLVYLIIQNEKKKLVSEVKDAIVSSVSKAGLIEKLLPIAERIGERLVGPKSIES